MLKFSTNLSYFFIYFLTISLSAQTPCSSGTAGVYPCSNIDLQSYLSLADLNANLANDIWGWVGSNGVEYAIVGLDNGTSFVDVSNPANPVIIGKLPRHSSSSNSTWRDIKVVNGHAYIGSEASGHGIQIFDLSRLESATNYPVTFTEDGRIDLPGSADQSHNIVVSELTNHIMAVGTYDLNGGGVTMYNAANPTSPANAGSYDTGNFTHDAVCTIYRGVDTDHIGKEICISFNWVNIAITDITNKNNPTTISTFSYAGNDYCHQGWITEDHKYLLVDDEFDETGPIHATRTYIFDLSNLDSPTLKYTYVGSTNATDHNLYVKGPYAYQANYTSGLRIIDISDLDNNPPTEVAFFDNHPQSNSGAMNGVWSVYPYFKSGTIVMTNIEGTHGGLHVVTPNVPHYALRVEGDGMETICQGETATYTFDATAYSGFTNSDNITITGAPNGATATLSTNPINTNGFFMLNVVTTAAVANGFYNIVLTGTELPVNRVSVGLEVTPSTGGLPNTQLVSPENNEQNLPVEINFDWNPVPGATLYDLEIATDQNFDNIIISAYDLIGTSYNVSSGLEVSSGYYWRVNAKDNACASSNGFDVYFFITVDNPVPVELITFQATPKVQSIFLEWQTASEEGFDGFELQRASEEDPTTFRKVAWIESDGTVSNSFKSYSFEDTEVVAGTIYYYRLKQLDLDGTFEYSSVVTAQIDRKENNLQLFPNPAEKEVTLLLQTKLLEKNITLSIYDVNGKLMRQQEINADAFNDAYLLDISYLPKGAYIVSLENESIKESVRFVKQ